MKHTQSLRNKVFNSLTFKFIALISMIIDHVGFIIYPGNESLRIIGRIALPIFTFLMAFGFDKTRNPGSYFLKFFFMFIVIQIPTTWYLFSQSNPDISPFYMNIFGNLTLGAGFILIYKKNKWLSLLYFSLVVTFLVFIHKNNIQINTPKAGMQKFEIDYGLYGFLLIVGFWISRQLTVAILTKYNKQKEKMFQTYINLSQVIMFIVIAVIFHSTSNNALSSIQLYALLDIPLIILFTEYRFKINSKAARETMKYFFWLTYPLTLGITILAGGLV